MKSSREFQAMARSYLRLLRNTLLNAHYRRTAHSSFSENELQTAREAIEAVKTKFGNLLQAEGLPQSQEVQTMLNTATPQMICELLQANRVVAHTLLEESGLDNVEFCARKVLAAKVPGDFIECGVFRGGTAIYMRGLLKALEENERLVWVADSFQGLPQPDPLVSPVDAITHEYLKMVGAFNVSLEDVQNNFRLYDLLDQQVRFLPGWFSDTLTSAPIEKIALLRLDADYYESTLDILNPLYPKVSPGGIVIIDDYGSYPLGARRAVDEYRAAHGIKSQLVYVNSAVVFWQKTE